MTDTTRPAAEQHTPPARTRDLGDELGLCPACHGEPVMTAVWNDNWAYCERCLTTWRVGYNVLTTYNRLPDEALVEFYGHADRDRITAGNIAFLERCTVVTPYFYGAHEPRAN